MKEKMKTVLLVVSAILMLLFLFACKKTETPAELPPPAPEQTPTIPPEIIIDVQTNFDVLTTFEPLHLLHTRLHEGAMPELVPSNDYGMLLPYSNATVSEDGSLHPVKFGFVTIDGVIVTDLIYDSVERADFLHGWYVKTTNEMYPAYSLYVNTHDPANRPENHDSIRFAACALDGSWITPFDYTRIIFTGDVIILYRDEVFLDIDVIDYSGKHLYNMLDLSWTANASNDPWSFTYMEVISDRYAHVRINSNTFAFIDLLTGNARSTRFTAADPFIEGHAPVSIGIRNTYYVIWGLINTDFQVVIQPTYYNLPYFIHGKAIVERRDRSQYVINTKGENLFNVPDGYWLAHSYEGPTFIITREFETNRHPTYLSSEFEEIKPSEGSLFDRFDFLQYLGNGWYTTRNENATLLFNDNEEHYFHDYIYINYFDGEFLVYMKWYTDGHGHMYSIYGVMTPEGNDIILAEPGSVITPVFQNDKIKAFIISTGSSWYITDQEYNPDTYRLVDIKGNTMTRGSGILTYHETLDLYSVLSANGFLWLDNEGITIISIPLLSSVFD